MIVFRRYFSSTYHYFIISMIKIAVLKQMNIYAII